MPTFPRSRGAALAALALALAAPDPARANCGLDHCPRHGAPSARDQSVSLLYKHAAFDLDSGRGFYDQTQLAYEYSGLHGWVFGGDLPVTALHVHGAEKYGLSNPLLYATWYGHLAAMQMWYLGLQVELPFGNADEGMASDHFMLVPYALWEGSFGPAFGLASLGYSQAFATGGGDEMAHPLYVNPHEDQELLYRAGAGWNAAGGRVRPQAYLDGQYALVGDLEHAPRKAALALGGAVDLALGRYTVIPQFSWSLLHPARYLWNAGLAVKAAW